MELGVHLPLIEFGSEGQSLQRLQVVVDTARNAGFTAIAANDHFVFRRPWLDGLTALASVVERSRGMTLATTISLAALRGPVQLAKALAALDLLSDGRLVAGVGPGSSRRDYEAVGVPFDERWGRFEEAVKILRSHLRDEPRPRDARFFTAPEVDLAPRSSKPGGIPLWIGSWGSDAGLRRVARLGDGWLASAYNTSPDAFASARARLPDRFPNALVTMWTWITDRRAERERVLEQVLAPMVGRDVDEMRDRVSVGSAEACAALLSSYASAGCERVFLWPLGDEARQIETLAGRVLPQLDSASAGPREFNPDRA